MNLRSDLRFALSPADFASELLGLELDPWQRGVLESIGKRDILNITRQGGKSTVSAVLALHQALYRPGSLSILVSPSQRQSGELFRKCLEFKARLPRQSDLVEDSKTSLNLVSGGRIVSLPGSEATVRGFSAANLIIADEAARIDDSLYLAIRPMLATSNGRLILMSTPFGRRGFFWREWDTGVNWNRVEVPATSIPRISAAFLAEERASMPALWYSQEYCCVFGENTDSVFAYADV